MLSHASLHAPASALSCREVRGGVLAQLDLREVAPLRRQREAQQHAAALVAPVPSPATQTDALNAGEMCLKVSSTLSVVYKNVLQTLLQELVSKKCLLHPVYIRSAVSPAFNSPAFNRELIQSWSDRLKYATPSFFKME